MNIFLLLSSTFFYINLRMMNWFCHFVNFFKELVIATKTTRQILNLLSDLK